MNRREDKTPRTKVVAATGGTALGVQAGIILVAATEYFIGIEFSNSVDSAIVALAAAAVAFAAGYIVREF